MEHVYVKIGFDEALQAKRQLLEAKVSLLESLKRIEELKKIKLKKAVEKSRLRARLRETLKEIKKIQLKIPKSEKKLNLKTSEDLKQDKKQESKEKSIEQELREIKLKLASLNQG